MIPVKISIKANISKNAKLKSTSNGSLNPNLNEPIMLSIRNRKIKKQNITKNHFALIMKGLFLIITFNPINKKTIAYNNTNNGIINR
jgi:hypothetical protein